MSASFTKFVRAPLPDELARIEAEMLTRARLLKKKKTRSIQQFTPTICVALKEGRSYEWIKGLLFRAHAFKVDRSNVYRFVHTSPELTKLKREGDKARRAMKILLPK